MSTNIGIIESSLMNVSSIVSAADLVLNNPKLSFESQLKKQYNGEALATSYVTTGAVGLIATSGAAGIESGITAILAGLGCAGALAAGSGPAGWIIGGTAVLLTGGYLYKKWQAAKRAQQEKDRLKNLAIQKQQAIIRKLKEENARNAQEIKNLKNALESIEALLREMTSAA